MVEGVATVGEVVLKVLVEAALVLVEVVQEGGLLGA